MKAKWGSVIGMLCLAVISLSAGLALAAADDLAKQADKITREAERNMHSGKNSEADALLNEAAALIEQVKAQDPNNKKISSVEKNHARIRNALDRKLGQAAGGSPSSARPLPPKPQPKEASSAGGAAPQPAAADNDKLPSGVQKRLRDIAGYLDSAEDYAGRDAKKADYKLKQADELFAEIDRNYGGKFDTAHPEYAAARSRYASLTEKVAAQGAAEANAAAAAEGAKADMEKQSAEWVAKFRAYLSYPGIQGHDPAKLVYVPGGSEPEKFADAQKRFEEFKAFYAEYQKTEFPNGRTWELEDLADREAPYRIKIFEEEFANRVKSVSGDAEREIDAAMQQLEKDNGWKSDKTVKPNLVDRNWMTRIREATEKVVTALGTGDPQAQAVQAKFDALVAKDKENREIRKERTFMIPDRYKGGDIGELKKKAEALVRDNKKEGGTPLRCTIISENWQEQTVEEWTDTTKTVWRKRTTRSLTAQVAAKASDGVRLITVALAKDRQSGGGWGPLYGNLHQGFDPMLEANVNK